MKYYKYYRHESGEYYRIFPDDHYEYYPAEPNEFPLGWRDGSQPTWTGRWRVFIAKPLEVSELEILVILGPEAVMSD
jgi:hypothetical protein